MIETDRLVLVPLAEHDRAPFSALAADQRVIAYMGAGTPWRRPQANRAFDDAIEHWRTYAFGWHAGLDRLTREWRVLAALKSAGPQTVEVGWWVDPEFWGLGLATEAGQALVAAAFRDCNAERVVARVHPDNAASIRVIEKLGLHYIGSEPGEYGPLSLFQLDEFSTRH